MADLSFSSTPILGDLYTNAQDALARSIQLGCNGYRTYIVNGITSYVPCSSYIEYEKTLRFHNQQGKLAAFGSDVFGDKLVGMQFANANTEISKGDPFFTLGNFSISKSIVVSRPGNTISAPDTTKQFTLDSIAKSSNLSSTDVMTSVNNSINSNLKATVLFDPRKLENYVRFSSLAEGFKNSIIEITQSYPGGIKLSPTSILNPTVTNFIAYTSANSATFKVNVLSMFNPFGIDFTNASTTKIDDPTLTILRNFGKSYTDFVILYNGIEYPITNATLPTTSTDTSKGLVLTVSGLPFVDKLNNNNDANVSFHIKPSAAKYDEFISNLSNLSKFLLTYNVNEKKYKSEFTRPVYDDNGNLTLMNEAVYFPMYDNVNLNLFDSDFDDFLSTLNDISSDYDNYKTNIISRFLTTDSLHEFDTPDRKIEVVFQMYGRIFDEVQKYIDGLSYMTNLSYDKIENIPDVLVKNFANMLGIDSFTEQNIDTMVANLFTVNDTKTTTITPAELDIELWRRIAINAFYLFKSKGTRKGIDFILKLVGVPDYLIEINEYIYLADNTIDPISKLNQIYRTTNVIDPLSLLGNYPFDSNGYPTVPSNVSFQENGGYFTQDSGNIGPYDFGKKYINAYTNFDGVKGFTLFKTVDNVKSWVYSETPRYNQNDEELRSTYYYEKDSRLAINSKELEVYLSLDRIMDHSIYNYFKNSNIDIDTNLFSGYTKTIQPGKITFNQFMKQVLDDYIQVENRKTIKTYPTLTKIYFDFMKLSGEYVTYDKGLDFLSYFDTYWVNLIKQFIPATSIINTGKKIKNTTFNDNKFVYKQGLNNDINWLGTVGSEFRMKAQKPVYQGQNNVNGNIGVNRPSIQGVPVEFGISGNIGVRVMGLDPTINEYFGVYYSNAQWCGDDYNVTDWLANTDYTTTGYSGSLLYNSDKNELRRYGVFVVYNGSLFRLNTLPAAIPNPYGAPFDSIILPSFYSYINNIKPITTEFTSGTTYNQKPNNAKYIVYNGTAIRFTYSGTPLYTYIPRGIDAKNITFPDCNGITNPLPNQVEKEYFLKSISLGYAYIDMGVTFDCPPPQPHVCYYDYSGRTINLNFNSSASNIYPTNATYIDNNNVTRTIRQPYYYGYSKNTSTIAPSNYVLGKSAAWAVPYKKRKVWASGTTYYQNELIKYTPTPNVTYIVTGITASGTTTTPVVSMTSGIAVSTYAKGDMFSLYSGRTKTDPLMHVAPAYIDKMDLSMTIPSIAINLSKSINLDYVFSGITRNDTYLVQNNVINNTLYVSDSFNLNFDGFYSVNNTQIGPFYVPMSDETLIQTLNDTLDLIPNQSNYVSIQSLNTNFDSSSTDLTLVPNNTGYYLINQNSYLKFNIILYFTTEYYNNQSVKVRLVNNYGVVINEQEFLISGSNTPDQNMVEFIFEGFFVANEKVFLVVEPVDQACTLQRYEKIDYVYDNPALDVYDPVDEGRFRLMFNSGRKVVYGTELEYGLSISPLIGKYDTQTGTTQSFISVDNYIFEDNRPGTNHYYLNVPRLKYNQTTDPNRIFNKLFVDYYQKFHSDLYATDTDKMLYDKNIKYDKINFNFNINTKKLPYNSITTSSIGQYGVPYNYNITANDYYLGNVPEFYEGASVTNNILIGKNIRRRLFDTDNAYPYIPSRSGLNGSAIIGTGNTFTYQLFQAYDSGLLDYTQLDLNNPGTIYDKRRVLITGTTYQLENEVYSNEIYQTILNSVELYSQNIINYQTNDMVKFTINNYKRVVPTTSGYSIETVNVDRVFVCTQDITPAHCYKIVSGTTTYPYGINPIYAPLGAHSCFDELVRFDPKNYSPWGYERFFHYNVNQTNIYPYTNGEIVNYVETGTTLNLSFGNLVSYGGSVYRFIYNKPLVYFTGTTGNYNGQFYNTLDLVSYFVGTNTNWYQRQPFSTGNPLLTSYTPTSGYGSWTQLTTGGTTPDYMSSSNPFQFCAGSSAPARGRLQHNVAVRLPNLIPSDSSGRTIGWVVSGSTDGTAFNLFTQPQKGSLGNIIGSYPIIIDAIAISNTYNTVNSLGYYSFENFVGETAGVSMNIMNYDSSTNLLINNQSITSEVGNISYYPIIQTMYNTNFIGGGAKRDDLFNLNHQPIFEWLCYNGRVNNPRDFQKTRNYYSYSQYMIDRYAVSRGILYRNLSNIATTTSLPFQDTVNWVPADFCLVDNYTFYKDRTKVSVYESDIYSLTDAVKSNLNFFKSNLLLQSGFTINSFKGSSIDAKLKSGLDAFYDATDGTTHEVASYGTVGYRRVNGDIIMDYYYTKDSVGLPRTGEFIGKLSITDPCGHSATAIIGLLFNTDITQITSIQPNYVTQTGFNTTTNVTTNYYVRLTMNQGGANTVKISWSTDSGVSGTSTVNSGTSFDRTIPVPAGSILTVSYSYDTTNKNTMYDSGYYNTVPLFDSNNNGLNTTTIATNISYSNLTEIRTVTLPNITQNNLLIFNVKGLTGNNRNDYAIKNQIKL